MAIWSLVVAGCGGDDTNVTPNPQTDSGSDVATSDVTTKDQITSDLGTDRGNVMPDAADGDGAVTTADGDGGGTPDVKNDGDGAVTTADGDAGPGDSQPDRADVTADVQPDRAPDVTVNDAPPDNVIADVRTEEAGPPSLQSIEISPGNPQVAKGTTNFQLHAIGKYSDTTTKDITASVTWASLTTTVATIDTSGQVAAVAQGTSTIRATSGAISGSTVLTVTAAALVSISVNPTNPSIAAGTAMPFQAFGTYTDNTTQDITTSVTWSSSNLAVATINGAGRASGQAEGTATIGATQGSISNSTLLTVTKAILISISVTPPNPSIANNTQKQLTATGLYSDGTTQDLTATATWSSSMDLVATVGDAAGNKGLATGVNPGSVFITATSDSVMGSTQLTIKNVTLSSIVINPMGATVPKGLTKAFQAIGTFSDNTTQDITQIATWNCDDANVAIIDNAVGPTKGRASSVNLGTCSVTAAALGQTGSTTLQVTDAILESINVTAPTLSIPKGTTVQFTATGVYSDGSSQPLAGSVSFSSSAAGIATINPATGLATGVGAGQSTITATSGGIGGSAVLTVTPAQLQTISITPPAPSIAKGTAVQLTALGHYTDGSTLDLTASATWDTDDHNIATIDNSAGQHGVATGLAVGGPIGVTATQGSVVGTASLTVTMATLQSISVTPANNAIAKGTQMQFAAIGTYSDGSAQPLTAVASWASSAPGVASIDGSGNATANSPGDTQISATYQGVSGSTGLTVTPATLSKIDVTPTNPSIAKGTKVQFTATGTYSDSTTQDLTSVSTWKSSDGTKASVSTGGVNRGSATALAVGSSDISATYQGVIGKTTLTITPATLSSIAVTPINPNIAKGTSKQFTATGTYSDGTVQDLTATASWNSNPNTVASVDAAGLATSINTGSTTISALQDGITGSTTLTVTTAQLQTITIEPDKPTLASGTTLQFKAIGHYTDMSTQDLTLQVAWSSASASIVAIVPSGPSRGFATATGVGMANVTATIGAISGSTLVTVSSATLDSIDVSPTPVTIANGTKQQFTAMGHYSDGHSQDLTAQVTWASTNEGAATVSNAAGSQGLATSIAPGGTSITASLDIVQGTASLTVSSATLTSITVLPDSKSVAGTGVKVQYAAIGHFTSGPDQVLTAQVAWSSSDVNVAIISNSPPVGEATTVGTGMTNIRATFSGMFGETPLVVTGAKP